MAVKKTELYSSLWASCDALRGGMDASQYKDYILTLLFMKYVTDKYKGQKYGDLTVFDKANDPNPDPEKRTGCSFDDFIALKNKKNIGEGIDKIIARLAEVNEGLKGVIDIAHFNDEAKIGKDKEMVDKLTKLIAIFQRPELDFSKNKAEGDDIIGDAYEYLMRNFASESGKSKGQFYTPAEVSRILAKIIGIDKCTDHDATVCDPACGSGSLLIRALAEAPFEISGYGQEKDGSTAGLAKMNAVLHNKATIRIMSGNTFSDPKFIKNDNPSELERFDYIVANPPFSLKNWSDGLKEFGRFSGYGDRPPEKNGDYAWLMHILKTLKSTGKAAVILPHGVLFRGNAEATIRQTIVDKGWIKGIISLPPNLFYGTGIPACILVIDKEGAENRAGIFMIDAGKDYVKDGSKNRLREQDIYRIVTTFNEQITTDPKYARFVPNKEIKEKNGYNLNISRYIDSSEPEDIQDIYAHIHGGIPAADIDALEHFWTAFPTLKNELLGVFSEGYYKLNVEEDVIRQTTYSNAEFAAYGEMIDEAFASWKSYVDSKLKNLKAGVSAKELIIELAQAILKEFESLSLINKYDVYQVLLAYWNEVLSDDVSMIISDEAGYGVAREKENIMKETKKKDDDGNPELKVAGWEGKLIPKALIISELFPEEKKAMDDLVDFVVETDSRLMSLVEESAEDSTLSEVSEGGKVKSKDIQEKMDEIMSHVHTPLIDGLVKLQGMLPMKKKEYVAYINDNIILEVAYTEKGTVTKSSVAYALAMARAEAPVPEAYADDYAELKVAYELAKKLEDSTKLTKEMNKELDEKARERYATLTDDEIIDLLVNKKWYYTIGKLVAGLHTIPCRVKKGDFAPGWLGYYMNSDLFHNQILPYITGIKVSSISKGAISETLILVPPFDEQEKIVQSLNKIQLLMTAETKVVNKIKLVKNGCLSKMFPQKDDTVPEMRLPGFTEAWEQRKLGELVKEGILEAPLDGNHGEKHPTSDEYVDSGIPFLMASDIHNGEVNIYSCKHITKERAERLDKGFARNGDVLLTHKATIGETAILSNLMTEYAMLTPQVTYYRIKNEERLNREYLYSFFNSLDFQTELKTKAAQSTRPYIGITAQQNLKIILPAEIDEQRKIGLYFRNLDHLITLYQCKCDKYSNIKKGMMSDLLTGKIRLVCPIRNFLMNILNSQRMLTIRKKMKTILKV